MIDRRDVGSWLEGPPRPEGSSAEQRWPGERLGLPETGPRSVARFGRRLGAIAIDWALCMIIARPLFGGNSWGPLAIFFAESVLLVGTVGSTLGHAALGLRVELAGAHRVAGPTKGLIRSVLLCLVIPALIWDRDQRGLHDKAAGTVLVRR